MLGPVAVVVGASSTVKVAWVTAGTLLASTVLSGVVVLGQVSSAAGASFETLVPATALTGTSAALVWVVKQIAGGQLVHRDPASAEAALAEMTARLADLTAKSLVREQAFHDMLMKNGGLKGDK